MVDEVGERLTGGIHGHSDVFDDAVFAEYLADVVFFDVAGQCFYHDL